MVLLLKSKLVRETFKALPGECRERESSGGA